MDSYDETWYAFPLYIAAAVEIDVGVVSVVPRLLISRRRPVNRRYRSVLALLL